MTISSPEMLYTVATGCYLCNKTVCTFGNGEKIKKTADKVIAFGQLTWPHQMVKMMIAEQIYRIETIIQGHPYHK